jgi:hypothetical protein
VSPHQISKQKYSLVFSDRLVILVFDGRLDIVDDLFDGVLI